jgi:hypothetical protein
MILRLDLKFRILDCLLTVFGCLLGAAFLAILNHKFFYVSNEAFCGFDGILERKSVNLNFSSKFDECVGLVDVAFDGVGEDGGVDG